MMNVSNKALVLSVCMALGAIAAPGLASAIVVDVDVAPPPVRVETVPPARVGYVWAPGYWEYRGREHVWVGGRYIRERRGYHWVPDRWEQRGPHWHREAGHWER
jgi:hypothetical protein